VYLETVHDLLLISRLLYLQLLVIDTTGKIPMLTVEVAFNDNLII